MLVLGIDLAGSPRRWSGVCLLKADLQCSVWMVHEDSEILNIVKDNRPDVVAIDAPLSLPRGRRSLEERSNIHFRECDLELRRRGIKFFPITLGPMRMLTERGIGLRKRIWEMRVEVIEVFPGATQDILGLPRKHHDLPGLINGLRRLGINGLRDDLTGDEADAVTCALTGLFYILGEYEALGNPDEGVIIVPKPRKRLL